MNVLLIGGSSLLGKGLLETKPVECNEVTQTWFTNYVKFPMLHLDITSRSQISYILEKAKPDWVINCAAIGSVDYAHKYPKEVANVNIVGTKNIAIETSRRDIPFVHVSTNAVYDGNHPPYNELSEREPINKYGMIKKKAEDILMQDFDNWIIIRPFMMYGWNYAASRKNWFTIITEKLRQHQSMKLVNDVFWQPTNNKCVAKAIWKIIYDKPDLKESYNIAAPDIVTLHQFGELVQEFWHGYGMPDNTIKGVPSSYFKDIAPRPKNTEFDCSKIKSLGVKILPLAEGLKSLQS